MAGCVAHILVVRSAAAVVLHSVVAEAASDNAVVVVPGSVAGEQAADGRFRKTDVPSLPADPSPSDLPASVPVRCFR